MSENKPNGELARLREIFDMLDRDRDGTIPLRDFHSAMTADSVTARELTDEQRRTLLRKADINEDGRMNFREFALLTTSREAEGKAFRRFLYSIADLTIPYDQRPQVHSYISRYSCCPPPVFMIVISIVQVAIYLYYSIAEGIQAGWFKGCAGCIVNGHLGPFPFVYYRREEAWRFLSYMLVHAGNVLIQLILGVPLELVHKIWRVGLLYVSGVILGSMLQYSLDPNVVLVGASGGVYALIFGHVANLILNWSEMPFRWIRLTGLVLFIGLDIGHAIYRRVALDACEAVSYTAHVGGAVAGLLLGIVLLKNIKKLKWEKAVWWFGLGLFVLILIILIVMTILIKPGGEALFTTRCQKTSL